MILWHENINCFQLRISNISFLFETEWRIRQSNVQKWFSEFQFSNPLGVIIEVRLNLLQKVPSFSISLSLPFQKIQFEKKDQFDIGHVLMMIKWHIWCCQFIGMMCRNVIRLKIATVQIFDSPLFFLFFQLAFILARALALPFNLSKARFFWLVFHTKLNYPNNIVPWRRQMFINYYTNIIQIQISHNPEIEKLQNNNTILWNDNVLTLFFFFVWLMKMQLGIAYCFNEMVDTIKTIRL